MLATIRRFQILVIATALILLISCTPQAPQPPVAQKIPHASVIAGDTLIDNYFWLRERDDPAVIEYLEAENRYTEAVMKPTTKLQEQLYEELIGRIQEDDATVPVKMGDYYYYQRIEAGQQYYTYYRKLGSLEADEELILDHNLLAAGHDYSDIGEFKVSPNHQLLAFSEDTDGSEKFTIHFKNIETGAMLPDQIPATSYGLEWANDNQTVFYTILDEALRPYRCYSHILGTPVENDRLIYQEDDEKYHLSLSKTRSQRFILINLGSQISTEVRYLEADQPEADLKIIEPRHTGVEYYVANHGGLFYILTNAEALNFKLVTAPVKSPGGINWQTLIPHQSDVTLENFDIFQDYLVVYERDTGLPKILIRHLQDGKTHFIDFPEPAYALETEDNPEFDSKVLRFGYSSLITPYSVYDYNMETRERQLMKQDQVKGGYDPIQYVTERIFAPTQDGMLVPISIAYKKGLQLDGENPTFLYGYGAYGTIYDPEFSILTLSLLDRGFVYAMANVRGSSILGRQWYENGKLLHKKNTFTDFIACAEYLISEQYTNSEKLVIRGGSAGGLLMGTVVNMRPKLFKAVVASVPFVDILNTMSDPSIPLTVIEWEEWGNPNDPKFYQYMKSYSPYDNVTAKAYPNILITAGLNDPRVQYWEPAKWTAKLRSLKTDHNTLLLKTNMGKGHFSWTGRYDNYKEKAFEYAFIFKMLGIQF